MNEDKSNLHNKVENLEKEIKSLADRLRRESWVRSELDSFEEKLEFAWAGNLGRWEWNVKTGEVLYNKKKIEALGYKEGEINPKVYDFTAMLHPDDYEATMNNMREHLSGIRPAYEVEYRIRTKDGNYKWFYDRGNIVERDTEGKPARLIGIVFDITERKEKENTLREANEKLKELNSVKDKFFSIIAHDLRNPFNSLFATTEYLYKNIDNLETNNIKDYIKDLSNSSKQLLSLMENLLLWARAQTGKISFEPSNFDLYEVAFNALYINKPIASAKGISIENNIQPDTIVTGDMNMLNTVFRNIISNAVKFSNANTTIYINCKQLDDSIEVEVKDSGIGISSERIEKLFSVEHIYSTGGTDNESGTGLGLVLCKEFIEKHKGKIWVVSEPGKGSSFFFTIST